MPPLRSVLSLVASLLLLPSCSAFANASLFEHTMTVTASVRDGDEPHGSLMATVGDAFRGEATPLYVPFGPKNGTYVFGITVYGHEGDTVTFSHRGAKDGVSLFSKTIQFEPDGSIGNAVTPLELR
jgi:hypothetical protein